MYIAFGIVGLIVLSYAVWVKNGRSRGIWAVLGGALMLVYSISIRDPIFIILQIVFIVSSYIEILRISRKK